MAKRSKRVAIDTKKVRLRRCRVFCGFLVIPTIYISYCLSGLYLAEEITLNNLSDLIMYYLKNPKVCYNEKTGAFILVGLLIWAIASLSACSRLNNNLMHGNEYGNAHWGSVKAFNRKYASKEVKDTAPLSPKNKVLSENLRMRYDSDTLRNNNIFAVGGSGAGKTSFFLTPNLLSLHDCNIYTDPKGGLVEELGAWLSQQKDTKVYVLNMCEMQYSMHFNPFPYIRKKGDVSRMVNNFIQNTSTGNAKNNSADPFWERAERMFLEALFLYVWLECPRSEIDENGKNEYWGQDLRTVMRLLNEAQFVGENPPKLDARMQESLPQDHPARNAYERYRSGPDETIRSVIMTVNVRMQPFDNQELLDVFSGNDIPLDEFGVGKNGDKKTKSNLFIVIPDDDDTFNFVPGMVYTLLFQELYRQARFFGGKLPLDVGFWFDEFANIKMPANFDKILATCRSRGVYCVPILQSLAQIKTLFAEGAWEGIIGNCDTFLYLGGNEASTFEYISKLLGKWTIDKKSTGESKGSSGSSSENFDVLGRELMQEYEIRLLPDDECIVFVRGESPIRDKKWYPWEHDEYAVAKACGKYVPEENKDLKQEEEDSCRFVNAASLDYARQRQEKGESVSVLTMDMHDFLTVDLDTLRECNPSAGESEKFSMEWISQVIKAQTEEEEERREIAFMRDFDNMTLLDIFSSDNVSDNRRRIIRELLAADASEEDIKNIIHPRRTEAEVGQLKEAWQDMHEVRRA